MHPRCTDNPAELGVQDFVIICLKAHSITGVLEQMQPLLGPHTRIVTAVNGIPYWYFYKHGGAHEGSTLESIDPGGRQWRELGPRARHRLHRLPRDRDRGARRDPPCLWRPLPDRRAVRRDHRRRAAALRSLHQGRHAGADARPHPRRDLAQAVGQRLLQSDQRADPCDARRDLHRSRHARAVEGDHAGEPGDRRDASASGSASMSSGASKARARSARTRPRCCRTSSAAARWRSIRWSPWSRRWAA